MSYVQPKGRIWHFLHRKSYKKSLEQVKKINFLLDHAAIRVTLGFDFEKMKPELDRNIDKILSE